MPSSWHIYRSMRGSWHSIFSPTMLTVASQSFTRFLPHATVSVVVCSLESLHLSSSFRRVIFDCRCSSMARNHMSCFNTGCVLQFICPEPRFRTPSTNNSYRDSRCGHSNRGVNTANFFEYFVAAPAAVAIITVTTAITTAAMIAAVIAALPTVTTAIIAAVMITAVIAALLTMIITAIVAVMAALFTVITAAIAAIMAALPAVTTAAMAAITAAAPAIATAAGAAKCNIRIISRIKPLVRLSATTVSIIVVNECRKIRHEDLEKCHRLDRQSLI